MFKTFLTEFANGQFQTALVADQVKWFRRETCKEQHTLEWIRGYLYLSCCRQDIENSGHELHIRILDIHLGCSEGTGLVIPDLVKQAVSSWHFTPIDDFTPTGRALYHVGTPCWFFDEDFHVGLDVNDCLEGSETLNFPMLALPEQLFMRQGVFVEIRWPGVYNRNDPEGRHLVDFSQIVHSYQDPRMVYKLDSLSMDLAGLVIKFFKAYADQIKDPRSNRHRRTVSVDEVIIAGLVQCGSFNWSIVMQLKE